MANKEKQSIILAMVIYSVASHYLFKATDVFVQRFFLRCSISRRALHLMFLFNMQDFFLLSLAEFAGYGFSVMICSIIKVS